MKIRIKGDSIRLRLTQSEIEQIARLGVVSETITFGAGVALTYTLEQKNIDAMTVVYAAPQIKISLPKNLAVAWTSTEQVGIETVIENGNEAGLRILVEKDFKCLTVRPQEDESDAYPHPNENEWLC